MNQQQQHVAVSTNEVIILLRNVHTSFNLTRLLTFQIK